MELAARLGTSLAQEALGPLPRPCKAAAAAAAAAATAPHGGMAAMAAKVGLVVEALAAAVVVKERLTVLLVAPTVALAAMLVSRRAMVLAAVLVMVWAPEAASSLALFLTVQGVGFCGLLRRLSASRLAVFVPLTARMEATAP